MNKVILIGHLGGKPEIKVYDGDKKVVRVSLATNSTYKNKEGVKVKDTTWINIVAWNNLADIISKYTDKGSQIAVEGKITNNTYTDKDGVKHYSTEVHISDLVLLDSKSNTTD